MAKTRVLMSMQSMLQPLVWNNTDAKTLPQSHDKSFVTNTFPNGVLALSHSLASK
jgi:hypothetical protein